MNDHVLFDDSVRSVWRYPGGEADCVRSCHETLGVLPGIRITDEQRKPAGLSDRPPTPVRPLPERYRRVTPPLVVGVKAKLGDLPTLRNTFVSQGESRGGNKWYQHTRRAQGQRSAVQDGTAIADRCLDEAVGPPLG